MSGLDIREKAEGIAHLFRERRQIDILPPELMPSGLDEATGSGKSLRRLRRQAAARSPATRSD
jgi:hypothetical protein